MALTPSLKNKYIDENFFNSIPINCCISLTDANDDCGDIFGSIPSFVIIPFVVDYTITTQLIYDEITNKENIFYGSYTFFDILATLLKLSTTELELTISNYLSINPFNEFPSAYGYDLFDVDINGSRFGSYELVFTKDIIIADNKEIYNQYNNGGIGRLPESQSIFKSMGIVPFFTTQIFNCNPTMSKKIIIKYIEWWTIDNKKLKNLIIGKYINNQKYITHILILDDEWYKIQICTIYYYNWW